MRTFILSIGAAAALLLSGCGGGGGGSTTTTSTTSSVSGTVQASYLKGVNVCEAGTNNCATTDANGRFILTNVTLPLTLELRIGNSTLAQVQATAAAIDITPVTLAEGNTTAAAYIGAMLHEIAGCDMSAEQCDLSQVTEVDINETSDKPLVEELMEDLEDGTVTLKVDDTDLNVTKEDALTYESTNPDMIGKTELTYIGYHNGYDSAEVLYNTETHEMTALINKDRFQKSLINLYNNTIFQPQDLNDSQTAAVLISKQILVGYYEDPDRSDFIFAFQIPDANITEKAVTEFANKKYNIIDGVLVDFGDTIELNTTNPADLNGTWRVITSSDNEYNGTWIVDGDRILLKDENNATIASVAYKPTDGRKMLVSFDENMVFLEAKPLTEDELTGNYTYLSYAQEAASSTNVADISADTIAVLCAGEATLSKTSFSFTDKYCTNGEKDSATITLALNEFTTSDGTIKRYDGIAEVRDENNESIGLFIFAPKDGFFIYYDFPSASYAFGTNQPLE